MKQYLKIISLTTLLSSPLLAFDCPRGTVHVGLTLPTDGSSIDFCQKKHEGKLLKHGPYRKKLSSGVVAEEKHYYDGKEVNRPTEKKAAMGNCLLFKKAIKIALNPTRSEEKGTDRRIVEDDRLCPGYPMKRLRFLAMGNPFTIKYTFKEKCHMKGNIRIEANKKLSTFLETRKPFLIDSISFDYTIQRLSKGANVTLQLRATNGVMKRKSEKGEVKFSFYQETKANLIDIKASMGRRGLYTGEPDVNITEAFGKGCS